MVTKVITIHKKGGGTRRQAVEVLKSGKFKFIKNTAANLKSKAKKVGAKVRSRGSKPKSKRKSNKQGVRSKRSMKGGLHLYPKSTAQKLLVKAGIGTLIGTIIRLATMFNRDQRVQELGFRAANVGASYAGGGSGNLGFQAVDFALSHVIAGRLRNGNGNQLTSGQLILGGA